MRGDLLGPGQRGISLRVIAQGEHEGSILRCRRQLGPEVLEFLFAPNRMRLEAEDQVPLGFEGREVEAHIASRVAGEHTQVAALSTLAAFEQSPELDGHSGKRIELAAFEDEKAKLGGENRHARRPSRQARSGLRNSC